MVVPNTDNPYRALDISWGLPTQPNGDLKRCTIIEINPDTQSIIPITGQPTSHTLSNRAPDTLYTFQVFCSNTFSGALSGTMTGRTLVGGQYTHTSVLSVLYVPLSLPFFPTIPHSLPFFPLSPTLSLSSPLSPFSMLLSA